MKLFDRHTLIDLLSYLLRMLRRREATEEQPERDPSTPAPVTPLERLEAKAASLGVKIHDFRGMPRDKEYNPRIWGWPRNKKRGRARGKRSWDQTTAIMLHTYGVSGMGANRFLGVPAHGGIADNGDIVLMHDQTDYMFHGDRGNKFSTGIEISGVSDFDNPKQIQSARALVQYYREQQLQNRTDQCIAGDRVAIMGHSFVERSKPNCPGPVIWKEVGRWAIQRGLCVMGPVLSGGRVPE